MGLFQGQTTRGISAVSSSLTKAPCGRRQLAEHSQAFNIGSKANMVANGPDSGSQTFLTLPWKLWPNRFAILDDELCAIMPKSSSEIPPSSDIPTSSDLPMPGTQTPRSPPSAAHLHSSTTSQKPNIMLLTLPLEIRENIYKYLVPVSGISNLASCIHVDRGETGHENYDFMCLIRTCAQIHDELAPFVYKHVNIYNGGLPVDFLQGFGSNVRLIKSINIDFTKTGWISGIAGRASGEHFPVRPWGKPELKFPLVAALYLLQAEATSLRTLYINMEEFSADVRDSLDRFENPQDRENLTRDLAPEVLYTLRELVHFKHVEKIIIGDEAGQKHFWDPVVLYYLRGQLGFDLRKAQKTGMSQRVHVVNNRPSDVLVEVQMEHCILINPRWEADAREKKMVAEFQEQDYGRVWKERVQRRWTRHAQAKARRMQAATT